MKIKDISVKLGVKQGNIDGIIKRSKLQTDFEDRPSGNHHSALSEREKRLIIRFIWREPLITPVNWRNKYIPKSPYRLLGGSSKLLSLTITWQENGLNWVKKQSTSDSYLPSSYWEKIPRFVSPGFSQMRLLWCVEREDLVGHIHKMQVIFFFFFTFTSQSQLTILGREIPYDSC